VVRVVLRGCTLLGGEATLRFFIRGDLGSLVLKSASVSSSASEAEGELAAELSSSVLSSGTSVRLPTARRRGAGVFAVCVGETKSLERFRPTREPVLETLETDEVSEDIRERREGRATSVGPDGGRDALVLERVIGAMIVSGANGEPGVRNVTLKSSSSSSSSSIVSS